jgi:hypothetical protein
MKKHKANINNLSTEPRFSAGDMVAFTHYASSNPQEYEEKESHGIIVEVGLSIAKVRPLTDFSNIVLCNVADCRLATVEKS